jgi:seryl-tRNA synthetase
MKISTSLLLLGLVSSLGAAGFSTAQLKSEKSRVANLQNLLKAEQDSTKRLEQKIVDAESRREREVVANARELLRVQEEASVKLARVQKSQHAIMEITNDKCLPIANLPGSTIPANRLRDAIGQRNTR